MREILLAKLVALLRENNFDVATFTDTNSCFDIMAKINNEIFLIKVLSNVDSIRPEQADDLKKLSAVLNAKAFIIGERTKVFDLKDGVLYERYSLPVLSLKTFSDVLKGKPLFKRYFKGKEIVLVDRNKLNKKMSELGINSSELAKKVSVTKESILRYTKGETASFEVAERISFVLGSEIFKNIDFFEEVKNFKDVFDEQIDDEALYKLKKLGLNMAIFQHAPFKAYSDFSDLIIARTVHRQEVKKKAMELKKAQSVFESKPFVVVREFKKRSVESIPIVEESELDSFSNAKDFVKEISRRSKIKAE
ncbi:MAG: hypothetical protein N3D73_00200 [Candidatus Diapherotrites archaeon]|nr:hypothetical protein [Candidatus Diapherotrites archaeon]